MRTKGEHVKECSRLLSDEFDHGKNDIVKMLLFSREYPMIALHLYLFLFAVFFLRLSPRHFEFENVLESICYSC